MKCVICKVGQITAASVQAEIKVGQDRLLVTVEADACIECGEPYYSVDTVQNFERLREEFARNELAPQQVGKVYELR